MVTAVCFRKDTLDNLAIHDSRYSVSDSKIPGFQLVVYPTGVKTYILYRKVKGRPQRIKIGRYSDISIEQARKKAISLNATIALGGDPFEDAKTERNQLTFKELYQRYHDEHAQKYSKHSEHNRKMMELHMYPKFGNKRGGEITRSQMKKFHTEIAKEHGKALANRIIAFVSAVYNFCIDNEYYQGINPCSKIKKYQIESRDRFLNRDELQQFFEALDLEEDLYKDFFHLLLYTGARKSNVLSMKWSDINLELNRWRLSEFDTKNKDVNIIHLSKPAVEILNKRKERNEKLDKPSAFVFPGTGRDGYLKDPKKSFDRIRKQMNICNFRIHDLRRTLGSYMAISGISLPMIGKALNHKSYRSTEIYARLSHDPVLEAVNIAASTIKENRLHGIFRINTELFISRETAPLKFFELAA